MIPLFYVLLMNDFPHKDFYAVLDVVCFVCFIEQRNLCHKCLVSF